MNAFFRTKEEREIIRTSLEVCIHLAEQDRNDPELLKDPEFAEINEENIRDTQRLLDRMREEEKTIITKEDLVACQ